MKIAMIGHKDFPSRSGGIEVVVYELATRLAQQGHAVTVYNRGRRPDDNHGFCEGVEYYRTATTVRYGLNALFYSITATLHALSRGYDLIHYHALGPSVMLLLARLRGIPTVATVHGLDWQRSKWSAMAAAYLKLGEKIIARFADEVIVLSEPMQQYFLGTYHRSTNLVENAVVPVDPIEAAEISARYELHKNDYVLFVARFVPEKGLHHLIEAFLRCQTDKKLVVAGTVPDDDYGRRIQQMAAGCGRIVFTGFVQGRILQELYSNCALFVLPSEVEGLSISLLEALSAGARCLTSDIPENTHVLRDFGRTFASGSAESLYHSLNAALQEPDENSRAEEQRRYIRENYCYDTVIAKTLAVYEKALSGRASAAPHRQGI